MSSSSKPTFSSSSEEEGLLLALACHCTMTPMTESSGKPLKGIPEYPSGPGQWHKCLIEAVRDGAGENRQRGLLLAGAPQTGRMGGVTHLQRAISTKSRRKRYQLYQEGRVLLGKKRGSLLLLLSRLRTEVSGLKREVCEQAGLWFPS